MDLGLVELASAVLGGGALTAAIGYARTRLRAKSNEKIAETIHDERVAPTLLERIGTLEGRLEERDQAIDDLQEGKRECEARFGECERRSAEQAEQIGELVRRIDTLDRELAEHDQDITRRVRVAVRETMHSTPPGAWSADEGPEPETTAGRGDIPPIRSLAVVSGPGPQEE